MLVDEKLILKLERLARLNLSEEAREALREDLQEILAMVDKLGEIDTEGTEPLRHMAEGSSKLRADHIADQLSSDIALDNAPMKEDGFFKVPKVIDRS